MRASSAHRKYQERHLEYARASIACSLDRLSHSPAILPQHFVDPMVNVIARPVFEQNIRQGAVTPTTLLLSALAQILDEIAKRLGFFWTEADYRF